MLGFIDAYKVDTSSLLNDGDIYHRLRTRGVSPTHVQVYVEAFVSKCQKNTPKPLAWRDTRAHHTLTMWMSGYYAKFGVFSNP
jgi:hypothetical protein